MAPISSILKLFLAACTLQSSLAAPTNGLTRAQAEAIVKNHGQLFLGNPSQALLDKTITVDYKLYSASQVFSRILFQPKLYA